MYQINDAVAMYEINDAGQLVLGTDAKNPSKPVKVAKGV